MIKTQISFIILQKSTGYDWKVPVAIKMMGEDMNNNRIDT